MYLYSKQYYALLKKDTNAKFSCFLAIDLNIIVDTIMMEVRRGKFGKLSRDDSGVESFNQAKIGTKEIKSLEICNDESEDEKYFEMEKNDLSMCLKTKLCF